MEKKEGMLNIHEAARELNMIPSSVRRAIQNGDLKAERVIAPVNQHGFYLLIAKPDLIAFRDRKKQNGGGRPRKQKSPLPVA